MPITGIVLFKSAGQVLGGLFLADFITGVFHWLEDRYGKPDWPIIGGIIAANQEHHYRPRAFLEGSFLQRNSTVFILGAVFLAGFWASGLLNLFTGSAVVFGVLANEVHRMAHRSPKENGRLITWVQRTGLMQGFRHHAQHHRAGKDSHYCVMTNYLNPALERTRFFRGVEAAIRLITGALPRRDESVNPRFRGGREWL